ncbi:MAG: EAL domain-containing protein [Hyphomicrobium sp.]
MPRLSRTSSRARGKSDDLLVHGTGERRLPESEELSHLSLQAAIVDRLAIISETDARGVITHANDNFCRISGYARHELIGKTHALLNSGYHSKGFWRDMYATISSGRVWQAEVCNRAKDGSLYWVKSANAAKLDANGKITGYVSLRLDITDSRGAQEQLAQRNIQLDTVLKHIPSGISMFSADQRLVFCNERYLKMYGLPAELGTPGTPLTDVMSGEIDAAAAPADSAERKAEILAKYLARVKAGEPFSYTHFLGDGRGIRVSAGPMPDGGWVDTHEDITRQLSLENRIAHLAMHDGLTDLANRTLFRERFAASRPAIGTDDSIAVLSLDLDRFKQVNDTFGHAVGDALLKAVADRLRSCVRRTDTIARLGGDEFAILQHSKDPMNDAGMLAERIIDRLSAPYTIEGREITIGVSIGVAVCPQDGDELDLLLRKSDIALYYAKASGRGNHRFFDQRMKAQCDLRTSLEDDLARALSENQFELDYQPIYNAATGEINACEALLRWRHPERGLLRPSEFLPLAEETQLIGPIGEWVVRHACAEACAWPVHVRLAVNVSVSQLISGNFSNAVSLALLASGFPAERLEIEVSEEALLMHTPEVLPVLEQLRKIGVKVALDNFGAKYSPLSSLRTFRFDTIKVSQRFIAGLSSGNEAARAVVRAVAGLGCDLGISTVAEGVETRDQLLDARREGIDAVQGFVLARPKSAAELAQLFAQPPADISDAGGEGSDRPRASDKAS